MFLEVTQNGSHHCPIMNSHYKHQILYDSMSLDGFPIQEWVTFDVDVRWSDFTAGRNGDNKLGNLDVTTLSLIIIPTFNFS